MQVALPLLTLVPGISGGGETYARELCRALARVGAHEYEAVVPLAPDAGGGLATVVATGYRASTSTPGRLRAMAAATVRPGALHRLLEGADVIRYPLTVPVPPVDGPTVPLTLLDVQHLDVPDLFPRSERLFRRLAYDRAAHRAREVIVISEWVKERVVERLGLDPARVHAIHLGVDHERFTRDAAVSREAFLVCTLRARGLHRTRAAAQSLRPPPP